MAHDLLVDPLISWRDRDRRRGRTTLPGVLSRLASGELADFPRLRTHQLNPWCMFLTQLAAIALHRGGHSDSRLPEDEWGRILLSLTGGKREPWNLVVEDLSAAAFFQPPVPEGSVGGWKVCESPDDIDVLVTSKAHEVKPGLIDGVDLEAWVYMLSSLQTTQGYAGGAGGYNRVARMKSAYGNRPRVGLARDHTLSARFLRDVDVLLDMWPALVGRGYRNDGIALVWTESWNGKISLATTDLAPHFIEVCWRVRCLPYRLAVRCFYTTTEKRRCLPDVEDGDVGDAWIPVERGGGGALTVGSNGFNYDLMTKLLFEYAPATAQTPRSGDGDPVLFLAAALARGQGKTQGLHERTLVLAGRVRQLLGQPDGRAALGIRASARVVSAATMRSKVLYPSLKQLAFGGDVMRDDFDARVDETFFDHLFRTLPLPDDEARLDFERSLRDLAKRELDRAIAGAGIPDARRFKAISLAERTFAMCLRRNFPDITSVEATSESANS